MLSTRRWTKTHVRPNAETEFPTKTCPINETLFSQSGVLATDSAKAWAATSRGLPLPLEGVASDFMFSRPGEWRYGWDWERNAREDDKERHRSADKHKPRHNQNPATKPRSPRLDIWMSGKAYSRRSISRADTSDS